MTARDSSPVRVLVVDDEPAVRFALVEMLGDRGHVVTEAASGDEALAHLADVDVVVTDLVMPGLDGLALLREARRRRRDLPVIVLTARGSEKSAVEAMRAGAEDYLTKPFEVEEVAIAVTRAAEAAQLRREVARAAAERTTGRSLIGDGPAMRSLITRIERIAPRDVTVLVRGETGTGKELVATLLHALGPRASGPLVRFNCAAIPAELADAELFGHARGAFTGATEARTGYFARAHQGTLVLDEIGELPLSIQAKLLRAVQEGEVQPLGRFRARSTSASSRARIATCGRKCARAASAKTCTSGSRSSSSRCRHCASAAKTFRRSHARSRLASRPSGISTSDSPMRSFRRWRCGRGRGTCASWKT